MNSFHWQQLTVVWENERKWIPPARKSVTLFKICSFFYNWLPLVSTGKNNFWTKKKRSPLAGKSVFTSQNEGFHWNRSLSLVVDNYHYLLVTLMISSNSKIALTKKILFPQAENLFALTGLRILKNVLLLYRVSISTLKSIWKIERISVH